MGLLTSGNRRCTQEEEGGIVTAQEREDFERVFAQRDELTKAIHRLAAAFERVADSQEAVQAVTTKAYTDAATALATPKLIA